MNDPESSYIDNTLGANSIDCINDEESDCVPKKMNKKAKLREMTQLLATPGPNIYINIHHVPRKLIIFDINKVLLYRQAKSSKYRIRPYAHEFIAGMSDRFTIAVWTSMTKSAIPAHNKNDKPLFLKELSKVWDKHRRFNESNTILIDDSCEKCVCNPLWTSIHPLPYEPYLYRPRPPPTYPPLFHPPPPYPFNNNPADPAELCIDDDEGAEDVAAGPRPAVNNDPAELCIDDDEGAEDVAAGPRPAVNNDPAELCIDDDEGAEDVVAGPRPAVNSDPAELCIDDDEGEKKATESALRVDIPVASGTADSEAMITSNTTTLSTPGMLHPPQHSSAEYCSSYNMHSISTIQNTIDGAYANTTSTTVTTSTEEGDTELKPYGPLWMYLDRLAQYDGAVRDLFEVCGPYTPTLPK